jgi:hypothetical protein
MSITLSLADWGSLFLHFISLSLLAVGGAITTAPDIHRYLAQRHAVHLIHRIGTRCTWTQRDVRCIDGLERRP